MGYQVDEEREGDVKIHSAEPDTSLWASCDLHSNERMEILSDASGVLNLDEIPVNETIGTVTIQGDDVEFTPDPDIVDEYGWDE